MFALPILICAVAAMAPAASQRPTTADDALVLIKAGKVLDATGQSFAPGCILTRGGKIIAIGASVSADGAEERDFGPAAVITPGLIDANAEIDMTADRVEEGAEIAPRLRFVDALDPDSDAWSGLRANGVTTAFLTPYGRAVIAGHGVVAKTLPGPDDRWIVDPVGAIKATMGGEPGSGNIVPRFGRPSSIFYRRPTTRMGAIWEFRKAFSDARLYAAARKDGAPENPDLAELAELLDGKGEIRIRARMLNDIRSAIRLAEEFQLRLVIEEGIEAFRCPEEILAAKAKLIYGPTVFEPAGVVFGFGFAGGSIRRQETDRNYLGTPARLHAAGLEFALGSAERAATADGLAFQAALAVHHGLPRDVALRACTIVPAKMLGIAKRVGTLEVGKDADLVVWSGEPFAFSVRPLAVMVGGEFVDTQED